MALPTGTISMNDVNIELDKASGSIISLNDADVRRLADKATGTISLNDLKGKSNFDYIFTMTVGYNSKYSTYYWGYFNYGGQHGSMSLTNFYGFQVEDMTAKSTSPDNYSSYIFSKGASNANVLNGKELYCITTGEKFTLSTWDDSRKYINPQNSFATLMKNNVGNTLTFAWKTT